MKEIKITTKIADLLNDYEGMKEILIGINPKFKKLNNPILRRTIGKVATVKQAAIVGGMEPLDLLNKLRVAVGQNPVVSLSGEEAKLSESEEVPLWISTSPKELLDANKILEEDKNPLAEISKALKKIDSGEVVVVEADFKPEPLIDEVKKQGHEVFCQKEDEEKFATFIKKK
jgi:TusA-related sulfurtransferase